MRLIKVTKNSVGEDLKWYEAFVAIKSVLNDYELRERVDYECHYVSGAQEFHIFLNDGHENVASILALRFV